MIGLAIGGDFTFPAGMLIKPRRNNIRGEFLATGRDCMAAIEQHMGGRGQVLLPSYLCESIPLGFRHLRPKYYRVDSSLTVKPSDVAGLLKKARALVLIDYFGFPQVQAEKIHELCQKEGVLLVQDRTHSWLSRFPDYGDYVFASLRKMLPLPDGAVLKGFSPRAVYPSPSEFVHTRLDAALWGSRELYNRAEYALACHWEQPALGSGLSRHILERLPLAQIAQRRRANFRFLLDNWPAEAAARPLYTTLPAYVVPLGFPIVCRDRERLREELVSARIYPPTHWSLPKEVPASFAASWQLSRSILTIPIDQRYTPRELVRVLEVVLP